MNTLGWTDNSATELFTLGWYESVSNAYNGALDALLSAFTAGLAGTNTALPVEVVYEDVFKLARTLNASGRSTTHSNPVIARIAERLKRGPSGPRFH